MDTNVLVNLGILIVYIVTAVVIFKTLKENRKLAYLQFYEIIKRHHTEEITDLRRKVMTQLASEAEKAKSASKPLIETNPDLHLKASVLANYYEGLAMFLKGGWDLFPEEARNTMIEMLHNSVSKTWPTFERYKDVLYPNRPRDWAQSYQWLFKEVEKYRKERDL